MNLFIDWEALVAAYRHYHLAQDDEAILSFADALDAWTQATGQGWLVTLRELSDVL